MAEAAEAAVEQKGGKRTMIIIGGVVLLLMIGCGAGGYFFGVKNSGKAAAADAAGLEQASGTAAAASAGIGSLLAIDDIIVNLLDDRETRYLKAAITLELDSPAVAEEVEQRKPQVRDAVLLLMSSKTFAELRDLQGKLQLRAELLERINGFLQTGKVKTIYFTDFVVQ
ncbi:MAG: flagellar basal body-associated FliL family protein [Desulfobacterales bacterium]|nr:flagellar basal body-associated FliL family protein [Desulfobacterales bacterium]